MRTLEGCPQPRRRSKSLQVNSHRSACDMTGEERDQVTSRFSDLEQLVADCWAGLDRRRREPERREELVGCPQIIDHQVERRIVGCYDRLRKQNQVRSSA